MICLLQKIFNVQVTFTLLFSLNSVIFFGHKSSKEITKSQCCFFQCKEESLKDLQRLLFTSFCWRGFKISQVFHIYTGSPSSLAYFISSSPAPLFKLMALIIINQKHKEKNYFKIHFQFHPQCTDQIVLHPSEMVLLEQKSLILNMPSENAWVGADRRRRLSVRAAGQTISPEVDIRGYTRPHSTVTPTIRQNTKEEETILTVTLFLREIIQ